MFGEKSRVEADAVVLESQVSGNVTSTGLHGVDWEHRKYILERLDASHAGAVLDFELANRAYFAASISDRGDAFFDNFADEYGALLAEQETGLGAFYVLVAENGSVLGRFNLMFTEDGTANLGYRLAQQVAGQGVATATVSKLCRLAVARHGLRTLRAATSYGNAASQRVLAKTGFTPVGPAGPADLGGKHGTWYQLDLPSAGDSLQDRPGGRSASPAQVREGPCRLGR